MTHKTSNLTAQQIIDDIHDAFDPVRLEDGVSWHEADVIDDYGSAESRRYARELDNYEHWKDMPPEDLDDGSSSPSFLDAKGFRFYLPAYMTSILYGQQHAFATGDCFVWRLGQPDFQMELLPLLNAEQRAAIAAFLTKYSQDAEEASGARDLWRPFASAV